MKTVSTDYVQIDCGCVFRIELKASGDASYRTARICPSGRPLLSSNAKITGHFERGLYAVGLSPSYLASTLELELPTDVIECACGCVFADDECVRSCRHHKG